MGGAVSSHTTWQALPFLADFPSEMFWCKSMLEQQRPAFLPYLAALEIDDGRT